MKEYAVKLSPREMEVLELMAKEYRTKEMAHKLGISPSTVQGHKSRIFLKLDVKSTAGAIVKGIKEGVLRI